jgi:hypothetical protein
MDSSALLSSPLLVSLLGLLKRCWRRFKDADFVAGLASALLECFLNSFADAFACGAVMEPRLQDRVLCRGGMARVLYVRHFSDEIGLQQIEQDGK